MKTTWKSILMAGIVLAGAQALLAEAANQDEWFKAKMGRMSPSTEAKIKAEKANVAYREEKTPDPKSADVFRESFSKAKTGRASAMEEARHSKADQSTAYREAPAPSKGAAQDHWREEFGKAKLGRSLPK